MTTINGQARIHDMFVRSALKGTEPEQVDKAEETAKPEEGAKAEKVDQTEEAIKVSAANKADIFVGKVIGGTSISSTVAKGDATAAALEAAKVAAKTMSPTPEVADSLVKGATVVSGAVAAAKGDHFAAATTAKAVLKNSNSLSKLSVVADAVMLATGEKKIAATVQEVKKEAQKVVSPTATKSARIKSGLKLAQHTQSSVVLGKQLGESIGDLVRWSGKFPAFKGMSQGLTRFGAAVAASPLGSLFRQLGKLMPVLNLAALANSVRIALDIWRDPRSSNTSKTLVAGSVASGVVLFGASLVTGGAALVPAAAAFGVATELGLMATRKRDLEQGNTDRQMAAYITNPMEGAKALGDLVNETATSVEKAIKNVANKVGDKLAGGEAEPAAETAKTAPSGMLGAIPKF